jgi:methionyl-tRNA synthetase
MKEVVKMDKKKFYLSTAIAYTSATPHIGNVYEAILADAICRMKRIEGYDVYFQTGTDEHGQKIERKAIAQGVTPKEHVDKVANELRNIYDLMGVSYDRFIRTTDEDHMEAVKKIFTRLYEN